MKTLDPRIKAGPFLGKHMIFAPTSVKNGQRVRDLVLELQKISKPVQEVREEINALSKKASTLHKEGNEEELETIRDQIDELGDVLSDEVDSYQQKTVEYRKKIFDVMVDEWENGEPDDDWYASDEFDDFMLFRVVDFFLKPVTADLGPKG